jgi:hypothetical protein
MADGEVAIERLVGMYGVYCGDMLRFLGAVFRLFCNRPVLYPFNSARKII